MIAIIAALPREVAALVKGIRPDPQLRPDGIFLYRMPRALVVCAGMGSERALIGVRTALQAGEVSELISAGLAGGCDPELAVGSVIEARTVVDSLSGVRFEATSGAGTLVTTHTIASIMEKRRLHES